MFVNKSIAAILPYGGGCSQYVRIRATDAIDLPKEAGSNEVIALLSTYMTAYQCLESVAGLLHQRSRSSKRSSRAANPAPAVMPLVALTFREKIPSTPIAREMR